MVARDADEVQRADPRLRKRALAAVIATALGGAVAQLVLQGMLDDLRHLRGNEFERMRDALYTVFIWSIAGSALVPVSVSVLLWRVGSRVRSTLRFPPPGMRVIRDTVVLRADQAVRRGRLLQWLSILLLLAVAALLAAAWRLHAVLGAQLAS